MNKTFIPTLPVKINYTLRLLLAVFGGWLAARLCGSALAVWLALDKADATAMAIMLSYILFIAFGLWAFAARSLSRAVGGVLLPSALCAGLLFLKIGGGFAL